MGVAYSRASELLVLETIKVLLEITSDEKHKLYHLGLTGLLQTVGYVIEQGGETFEEFLVVCMKYFEAQEMKDKTPTTH